jgi:hypothetical protein
MIKKRCNTPYTKDAKGGEFRVQHSDGSISDAELHEPILDNPKAEATTREIGKALARRAGLSEDEIKKLCD